MSKKDIHSERWYNLFRGASVSLFIKANRLRQSDATPPEIILWKYLRNRKLDNYKFRRQHPIGDYIADFYCSEKKLIIELDGRHHNEPDQKQYDSTRTKTLNDLGIKVIRFSNEEVLNNIKSVLQKIRKEIRE